MRQKLGNPISQLLLLGAILQARRKTNTTTKLSQTPGQVGIWVKNVYAMVFLLLGNERWSSVIWV